MNKFYRFAPMLAAMLAVTACQDYDLGLTVDEIKYKQEFEKVFGNKVDANQTWSTASRSTLDVSVDMPSTYNDCTVKVYTANPRGDIKNSYLLGEWKVTNGSSSKLTFDMPMDLKTAWVAIVNGDGGRIVKEAAIKNNCCTAEFNIVPSSTRSAFNGTVTATTSSDWTYFPKDVYYNPDAEKNSFIEVYPENDLDYSLGLCTDFEFVATGTDDIRMTYFYSNTGGTDKLYFFKYDPERETLAQAYADYTNHVAIETVNAKDNIQFHWSSGGQSWAVGNGGDVDNYLKDGTYGPDDKGYVGRGHTVTISGLSAGEHIVFYLTPSNTLTYQARQDQIACTRSSINQQKYSINKDVQFAGVLQVGGVTYLGFEDALSMDNDYTTDKPNEFYDINDIVFTVTGGYTIEDHEDKIEQAMSYVIAYEDLGGSFDFDFNDIVLKATHVAGRNTATLTVLAAGGTLPVSISYDGNVVCSDVHSEFGQATTTVINAMPGQHNQYGTRSFTVTGIDSDHPFALNKISITVTRGDGKISEIHSPQYYTSSIPDEAHQVGATEDTSIPYAILIANPNWDWCDENISIATQDGFVDWVADASQYAWYQQGNTWGVSNDVPSNENVISGTTVYQKIPAAQFTECTYGATVTFTISDFTANGDLSFYTTYSGVEGETSSTALESQRSITVTSSSETTVTLDLSAHCEAFTSGLIVVYDNSKFKVSAISVTPAAAPSYGTKITDSVTEDYFTMFITKNGDGTYNLMNNNKTEAYAQNLSSLTLVCVAGTLNVFYTGPNWNPNASTSGSDSIEIELTSYLSSIADNGGEFKIKNNGSGGQDFALYWK